MLCTWKSSTSINLYFYTYIKTRKLNCLISLTIHFEILHYMLLMFNIPTFENGIITTSTYVTLLHLLFPLYEPPTFLCKRTGGLFEKLSQLKISPPNAPGSDCYWDAQVLRRIETHFLNGDVSGLCWLRTYPLLDGDLLKDFYSARGYVKNIHYTVL